MRLPSAVVEALELRERDDIEISVAGARELGIVRKPGRTELVERLRKCRGRLPADFRFDRNEVDARQLPGRLRPRLSGGSANPDDERIEQLLGREWADRAAP